MTDRELLELAAKAAGATHVVPGRCCGIEGHSTDPKGSLLCDNSLYWNPLTDDGDALRLARACNLTIQFRPGRFNVGCLPAFDVCCAGGMDEVRYAIVRAAAEIGKDMN